MSSIYRWYSHELNHPFWGYQHLWNISDQYPTISGLFLFPLIVQVSHSISHQYPIISHEYLVISHFTMVFHEINHPFEGYQHLWKAPFSYAFSQDFSTFPNHFHFSMVFHRVLVFLSFPMIFPGFSHAFRTGISWKRCSPRPRV